jgi:hypothetical protein
MSVFAPKEAMSDFGNHPPLEVLAAYIDGLLPDEEAARVAEHIANCEDCFFVYSETVQFQLEHPDQAEEPAADPAPVISFPPRTEETQKKGMPWWLGVAAAALLAVAVGIPLYRSLNPPTMPEITTEKLLASVQGSPDLRGRLYDFRRTRGEQGDSEFAPQSFMVGVFLTDLRFALETGDAEEASERLLRIRAILNDIGGMEEEVSLLLQEADQMRASSDLSAFLPKMEQWEKDAGQSENASWVVDPDYVTFGKWAEAGRLAAVLQKPDFFKQRDNRRVLSYVLVSKEMAVDEKVLEYLREIEEIWAIWDEDDPQLQSGELSSSAPIIAPLYFARMAEKFEGIVRVYDAIA